MTFTRKDLEAKLRAQGRLPADALTVRRDPLALPLAVGKNHVREAAQMVKPRKYKNEPCEVDGEKFDSKLEARVCHRLRLEHGRENVIRQVSIPLDAEKRIRPDFLIIAERYEDGSFRGFFVDAKGRLTDRWATAAAWLKDKHGLKIELIRK